MFKSKIFDVLQCFPKEDLKKFGEYLNSPLFNKRKVISDLFRSYKYFHPEYEDKNLTKEKIFAKIFPGKKFNDENFRNLNSILLKYAEEYLAYTNYSRDPLTIKKHLLSEISHRKILTVFEKNFEESKRLLESTGQRDLNYFYNEYELFLNKDIYNSMKSKFLKEDIMKAEKSLVIFFVMKILEIENYILYGSRILNMDKSLYLKNTFSDDLMKNIPEEIKELPQIRIYYNALKLEQTDNIKYYNALKKLIGKYGDLINREKHYNKYLEMIDFIKRTRGTKDMKSVSEIFQLRKEIIEKNLLMENTITNMFFLNIVKSGSRLKEFEWIKNFISEYRLLLIPKYRDITTELSLALFHFEKKEFNESLSHAAQVKYEDNFYNLEVKNLTTKIYYETGNIESLVNFISSYRMYLSKNRSLNKKDLTSHNTFLNYLDKLIRIKENKKFHKLDDLEDEISKASFVSDYWMLEQCAMSNEQ